MSDLEKFYNQEVKRENYPEWDNISHSQKIMIARSAWFLGWQFCESFKYLKDSILKAFNK